MLKWKGWDKHVLLYCWVFQENLFSGLSQSGRINAVCRWRINSTVRRTLFGTRNLVSPGKIEQAIVWHQAWVGTGCFWGETSWQPIWMWPKNLMSPRCGTQQTQRRDSWSGVYWLSHSCILIWNSSWKLRLKESRVMEYKKVNLYWGEIGKGQLSWRELFSEHHVLLEETPYLFVLYLQDSVQVCVADPHVLVRCLDDNASSGIWDPTDPLYQGFYLPLWYQRLPWSWHIFWGKESKG